MRAVGTAVTRVGFSETYNVTIKMNLSESLKVLELGAIKHLRVDTFVSTVCQRAVFHHRGLCWSGAPRSCGFQALGSVMPCWLLPVGREAGRE